MTTRTIYVLLTLVVTIWTTTTISEPTSDRVDCDKLLNYPALTCPIISLKEIKKILDTVSCNKECIFQNEIYKEFEEKEDELDGQNLVKMFNYVSEEIDFCCNNTKWTPPSNKRPSKLEVWLFGLLFVFIICLCSLFGGLIQPLMKKKLFNKLLNTFNGLAYGSLMSSAIFHLLPQALNLIEEDTKHHAYLNICLMIWVGIWVFFMTERLMNIIAGIKQKKESSDAHESRINRSATKDSLPSYSIPSEIVKLNSIDEQVNSTETVNVQPIEPIQSIMTIEDMQFGHRHSINTVQEISNPIATVAWMIIIGDALHNFIDGLSLGAAFNQSILTGFSISVAVIFEELLHELGDVAILLQSGMRMKQALKYNFMSSLTCILGLIVGILLGEFESSTYIFGFAAGMFIYISLVDMVPKMNEDAHRALQKGTKNAFITLFLQNIGLFIGTSVLFGLAKFPNVLMFE